MRNYNEACRIILADDHAILRTGLKMLLTTNKQYTIVGEAANGQEVLQLLDNKLEADILLLDLSMPVMSGLDLLRQLQHRKLNLSIIVLTMYNEKQYIKEAMLLGAKGYLRKESLDSDLFEAIDTVRSGRRYLAEEDAQSLLDTLIGNADMDNISLSLREQEVLTLIARGYSLSDIAHKLYLSVKTVSTYKTRLMTKLKCTQNSELVNYALKHKLLK